MPLRRRLVEVGRCKRCRLGDGLTRKPISDCAVGLVKIVGWVLGLRHRAHVAVLRLDGCCCVRWFMSYCVACLQVLQVYVCRGCNGGSTALIRRRGIRDGL
jgi:hypothetical protein